MAETAACLPKARDARGNLERAISVQGSWRNAASSCRTDSRLLARARRNITVSAAAYDKDFDLISSMTKQRTEVGLPPGSVRKFFTNFRPCAIGTHRARASQAGESLSPSSSATRRPPRLRSHGGGGEWWRDE